MVLDAVLAYLHFIAIFTLFAFLTAQAVILRLPLDARAIRLVGRTDLWYFGSAIVALFTGMLRMGLGAKGAEFYLNAWPFYAKLALFVAVGLISIKPTMAFTRWRRQLDGNPQWQLPAAEQAKARKLVMVEVHLAALIPVFAVIMSRGLGS
jgi:putative membrane protein